MSFAHSLQRRSRTLVGQIGGNAKFGYPSNLANFEIDPSRLQSEITRAIDRFKTGNAKPPALSPEIVDWLRSALLLANVDFASGHIRSGHLLCALLANETLGNAAISALPSLEKISVESLRKNLSAITNESEEAKEVAPSAAIAGSAASPSAPGLGGGKTPSLDQFTIDLTERAKSGKIDPVLGRDNEIRQIIDILCDEGRTIRF